MLNLRISVRPALGVVVLAALAACGGKDEDQAATGSALSAANEAQLSAATVQPLDAIIRAFAVSNGSAPGQLGLSEKPLDAALQAADRVAAQAHVLANAPVVENCDGGGTATFVVSDDLLSNSVTFAACADANGLVLNGSVSVAVQVAESSELIQVANVTLTGFSVTVGNIAQSLAGSLRASTDSSQSAVTTTTVTSDQVTFERSVGGAVQHRYTLSAVNLVHGLSDAGVASDRFKFKAVGSTTGVGSLQFDVDTPAALTTPAGASDPTAGQVKASFVPTGTLLLTVSGAAVRVQGDANGDGTFEIDRQDTWTNLTGGL